MRDDLARLPLSLLVALSLTGYGFRIQLQPSRAAAGLARGVVLWGIALLGVWCAWSQSRPACGASCEDYTAVVGEDIDALSIQP